MNWNRILSGVVAVTYLAGAYFGADSGTVFKLAAFLAMPLACIWYGDELGTYVGVIRGQAVTSETPGCLVRFGGWLLLLLPLIIGTVLSCINR